MAQLSVVLRDRLDLVGPEDGDRRRGERPNMYARSLRRGNWAKRLVGSLDEYHSDVT